MTKIDVYSGFLGAGKTTLIRKMIAEGYGKQKLVLIENEFGEIGIDGGFLQEAGIEIREMNSGCICCSLVGDFGKALEQVIDQYHPDRILIEPSGVGKLSDVIAAVKKVTNDEVQLGYTVAVADAGKCKVYMRNFGEFYNNQIETASTIVLSRTDSISQEKLDGAVALLREHNAVATMVTTPWDQLTGAQLVEAMEHKQTLADELAQMEAQRLAQEDEEQEKYQGKTVRFKAQVARLRRDRDGIFAPGRFVMTCCVEDIQFCGVPCKFAGAAKLKAKSWVMVTAQVSAERHALYQGELGPILTARSVESCSPAEQEIVTF